MRKRCKHYANIVQTRCKHDETRCGIYRKEKKRRKEKGKEKREEKRKGASSSSGAGKAVENLSTLFGAALSERTDDSPSPQPCALACLSTTFDPSTAYNDDTGNVWDTPWDALLSRFASKTGSRDAADFAQAVARKCPKGCDGAPGAGFGVLRASVRSPGQVRPDQGRLSRPPGAEGA